MNELLWTVLGLGFVLGLKHALDPDHLVAVSTIVSESASVKRSSLIGTMWGLGHTFSLSVVGVAVIVLKLRVTSDWALWAELSVAMMLILLGIKSVLTSLRGWKWHVHSHRHGRRTHSHLHMHRYAQDRKHEHPHSFRLSFRPLVVGLVHGMAGSAALTVLVLATIPSPLVGLIYILVFGLGSVAGMLLTSSLLSIPFVFSRRRFSLFNQTLQLALGFASVGFGVFLAWTLGFPVYLTN